MSGKAYSMREMKSIVDYLTENKLYGETRGRKMWMDYANSKLNVRTWQSLKETFFKRVLPDITNPYYRLDPDQILSFKRGVDLTRKDKKLNFRPVDKANNDNGVSGDNDQPCSSKNNNEENATGEDKKCSKILHDRASTETLILDTSYQTAEDIQRDLESTDEEQKREAAKNGSKSTIKSVRDLIEYTEPMLQEVLDDFATDEDCSDTERPMQIDENYVAQHEILIDGEEKIADDNIQSVKATDESAFSQLEDVMVLLDQALTKDVDQELSIQKEKQNKEANSFESSIPMTDSLLPNNQEAVKNTSTFGVHSPAQSTSNGEADEKKENMKEAQQDSKLLDASTNLISDEETDPKHSEAHIKTDCEEKTNNNETIDQNAAQNIKSPKELHVTDDEVHEIHSDSSASNKDVAAQVENPCLKSVNLYAEQLVTIKYSDSDSNNKENTNNELITKEVQKADETKENINQINAGTKCNEDLKNEKENSKRETTEGIILLNSWTTSESFDGSEMNHRPLARSSLKRQKDKKLASVFGFSNGSAAKSRRLGGRKRTISHHNMHSDSSEWTSTSDSEYVSPPRGRRNRYARKYLVDLTRKDKKLDFRPVDKANNDNGVSGDNDQPCSSKNNNEENATGEDKKCSKILHDRASTETLILDTSYQTAEDIQRDLESTDEEQKREAAKNGSKSKIKSVRDLIEYTEPMLQEVLDDFATDEDCSDTERPMQIDENYVAQHEILIDGEEKIADDNIQSVKATDESAFSQLEDVMVLLDQALTKDVDQELSIQKEKQNKEANSFESSIPMTDSLLPNNQEAVKNTSTFGVHSPAQSTSNGEADEKKENMKEAQQDSKLLDASTNLISDEETDPKHSEAHIKTDCEEKTNNNETIDQNAAQNIKSPKELHVTDDEVHEIHSDSSASNKDVAAQVENPCLKSVSLYAEQLVTIKYSDSDSNNKENTNNELITKEVQKDDETKENINLINAGTKCNEDLKNEKENSKGETTEGIILLNSWTTSESFDGSEMNHRLLARSSLKRQKDKKLASVFGFSNGSAAKSRRLGGRKRTISHHNMHSDSSEWTSTSDSEYVSPPRGRRNRYARKYLVDLTREDKKLDFRPVDKANNDNGVSGDNDQPCSSKNNNEENATGEDKKCSKILHDRASTETLILDTSYQTAEDIQRDLESTDEEQKREAAKNGSKSKIKSVRDLIEYTEPMLQEVLDDFATDEDCSDTERPMQIDENYVAQHEILIDGEEKIADDNIQSVKATDESAFSQLEDVMVLLDQALTKDVDQELSIQKEKQNKEANSFESSIPMTDSLLPNNQEAVKNTSTFGVHSPAQSTSNGEADEKKENMKEAQQDSKLLDASTNLISDEETDPKHSEAHIKTDCEEKTNNNETIDQNAAQNIKSPKELHVTDDEVHEIHSDSSASNKDVAAQVENPCLKSVSLYAEQLVTIKYSDSDSNNKENTNNELITKEVQKDDETKENINQINAGTKCNEDLKNEKENSKGETTEGIILLNSWTTSESFDGSEMNHRPLARSSLKRQKDKKLASVFGFSNGSAAKSRRLGGRKRTISHHNMHSDSSEWTSTSDSEYVSPPRRRRNRYARKYLKPRSAQIMSLEEEGGLCVMLGKKIYPLVKDGKAVKNYVTFLPESDPEEDGSYWKSKYIEERKRTADLKKKLVHSKSNGVLQKEEKENSVSLSSLASPLNEDRPRQPPSRQSVAGNEIMRRETGLEKSNHGTLKFKYTKNDQAVQLEGHWRDINPVLAQVVSMLDKEPVEKKKPETVTCVELSSGNTTPIVSPPVTGEEPPVKPEMLDDDETGDEMLLGDEERAVKCRQVSDAASRDEDCISLSVAVDGRAGRGRPVSALARAQLAMSCTVRLERLRGDEAPRAHASHTSLATLHESRRASPSRMQETHDNTAGLRAEGAYTCDTCGEHFTGKSSLIAHVRVRTHCGLAQDDSAATGSSGTGSKQLSCEGLFAKHTQAHTGQTLSYSCDMCTEQFRAKTVLIRHIGTHMDLKQYSCEVCNKMFKARSDLRRHVRIHTGVKPYSCGECNKQFSEKSNLESHKRIHTGVKPYRCEECNKQFRLKGDLNMHKRIHSGVKPYRCEQCHKRFTRKSDLDRHKRIHSGIKPYRCEECNKQFTRKSNLDRHKRIHAREKSFSCKECNKQNTK